MANFGSQMYKRINFNTSFGHLWQDHIYCRCSTDKIEYKMTPILPLNL